MSLPAALSVRTVTQTYTDVLGTPNAGTLTFTPVSVAAVGGQVISLAPAVVNLDTSGSISVSLPVGTDPDLASPLYISILEQITTGANQLGQATTQATRSYVVQVPAGAGSIALSSLPDVVPVSPYYASAADFQVAVAASIAAAASAEASALAAAATPGIKGDTGATGPAGPYGGTSVTDPAVVALMTGPSATATRLNTTYAPLVSAPLTGSPTVNGGPIGMTAIVAKGAPAPGGLPVGTVIVELA